MTTLFELRADQEIKDALRDAHSRDDERKISEIMRDLGYLDHRIVYSDTDEIFICPVVCPVKIKKTCNKYKRVYRMITNRSGTTYSVAAVQISK